MKISQLLLFVALLGHCFSDECADEFQQLIKTQCEGIDDSCSFYDFYQKKCASTASTNNDCSKGDGDPNICGNILPKEFPKKKCVYNTSDSKCNPEDTTCSDFNRGIAGITFDPIKDRSFCSEFPASTGKKCLIDNDRSCQEFFNSCNAATSSCDTNLIDYKNGCKLDGTCGNAKRSCDSIVYNVLEDECHELITSDSDKKCVYYESGGRGICNAEYISCKFYSSSPTCNNNHHPLIEKDNKYYLDLSKVCTYDSTETGTEKCKAEYVYCSAYTGDDKTVCPNLKVSDSTTKRCVYDPTSTSRICKEDYLSCNVYNDMITSKSRRVCESIILDDSSKKCIYINEIDKCIQTELFSTCDGYKGIDKYICESIITPTNHSKCYLEKDRTCKERMFNCSEVITEEDCLYYAKPVDSRKKCVYSSGKCYEEYQRCEDYSPLDETVSGCSSIIMHNGKKCYLDSTGLCRTKNKTCDDSYSNEDECNLIAQSGVSDPDKKVCDYFSGYCKENYKYCSDYRGNNDNNKCTNIKPYDDSGNNIDRAFKCKYTNGVGCEKISKACSEANGNPILCSLISPNIRDNNIKYCFYDGTNCIEQYKACENITSTDSTCTDNIPQNYLTRHCKVDNGKCISKTTCEEFNNINYNYNKYLCENIPNCEYSSGVCQNTTIPEACDDVIFYIPSDTNEETCKNIETDNPNTKCVLKEDKKGCEEIIIKPTPINTTQENSSGFLAKGIQHLIILLCLFI